MKKRITTLASSPPHVLRIDAGFVLFSIFLFGVMLPSAPSMFSVPLELLQFMTLFPVGLLVFNLHLQRLRSLAPWMMRTLYIGQYLYVITSFCLIMLNIDQMTFTGLCVLIAQMMLSLSLALFEFKASIFLERHMNRENLSR